MIILIAGFIADESGYHFKQPEGYKNIDLQTS